MDLPYEGFRRVSRGTAMESNTTVLAALAEATPLLRIPGATMPGVVHFQVDDPGPGNRAAALFIIQRERERSVGIQHFTVSSNGTGFGARHALQSPILGGGSADISGGMTVSTIRLEPGVPATVSVWVDWNPVVSQAKDRMPYAIPATISNVAPNFLNFGAPPSGARFVTIMSNLGTAQLTAEWQDATGARVSGFNGWSNGDPQIAMAGYFLELTNTAGGPTDCAVVYT